MNDRHSKVDSKVLTDALSLSQEILKNIEFNEIPLDHAVLKVARLARLINDAEAMEWLRYEQEGYTLTPDGVPETAWDIAAKRGRHFLQKEGDETKEYIFVESISALEAQIMSSKAHLEILRDPDISIYSSNQYQTVYDPGMAQMRNAIERKNLEGKILIATERLAKVRSIIYNYVLNVHYELKYSEIVNDIFARVRNRVDSRIGDLIPDAVKRFTAVYDNLVSDNPEDWSNAVHSCRRILKDLADTIYPARAEDGQTVVGGKKKTVKLGPNEYKNRILAFAGEKSDSERFIQVVGSNLGFLVDRLESIYQSASKGTHTTILSREEAERYVVYTYLLVGDVLSLYDSSASPNSG